MPPHGPQQTLFMGNLRSQKWSQALWSLGGAQQISCGLSPAAAFVFYPPFIPTSSRIGCIEGSGASLSRALVGSLYT
jgi:hypothetical protein